MRAQQQTKFSGFLDEKCKYLIYYEVPTVKGDFRGDFIVNNELKELFLP